MGLVRSWVRWALVGRRDGVRARVRSELGCLTWLDRSPADAPPPPVSPVGPPSIERPVDGVRLLRLSELPTGQVIEVVAGDRTLALANVDGAVYAVDGTCPHAGGPLGDGHLEGCTLTCPWHGWSYDLRTGQSAVDAAVSVRTFPVKVVDGVIYLKT